MSNVNFVLKSKSSMFKGFSVNFTALSQSVFKDNVKTKFDKYTCPNYLYVLVFNMKKNLN